MCVLNAAPPDPPLIVLFSVFSCLSSFFPVSSPSLLVTRTRCSSRYYPSFADLPRTGVNGSDAAAAALRVRLEGDSDGLREGGLGGGGLLTALGGGNRGRQILYPEWLLGTWQGAIDCLSRFVFTNCMHLFPARVRSMRMGFFSRPILPCQVHR